MFEFAGFDYQFVTGNVLETARSLISLFGLHDQPHDIINISPLFDRFDLRFMDLPPTTLGFALETDTTITIAVNDSLSTQQTRYVALHEIGHIACWHPERLHKCLDGEPTLDRHETEAITVAALVLIPQVAVMNLIPKRIPQVAARYLVPLELVIVRRGLYLHSGV